MKKLSPSTFSKIVVFAVLFTCLWFMGDNYPRVLEHRGAVYKRTPRLQPVETVDTALDSLARVYSEAWSRWWRMDEALARKIILAADTQRVPHHIAFGLVAIESGFDSTAVSRAGAVGLTQIKPSTARIYDSGVSGESLKGAELNLNLGLMYFHDLLHRYHGDVMLALAAYNMGPTKVDSLKHNGKRVSMRYSEKVMGK